MGFFTLTGGRFLISGIILIILPVLKGREKITGKDLVIFILAGLVYSGLFAGVFLKERLSWKGWAGAFLSILRIIAIVLTAGRGKVGNVRAGSLNTSALTGVLLVFGAAVTGAFYITSARYFMG